MNTFFLSPSSVQEDSAIIDFTIRSHTGQFRNTGEPFYMHPILMYDEYLCSGGTDPLIRQAILLHDVVEDTEATIDYIQDMFGGYIAQIVDANTCLDAFGNKLTKTESVQKFIRSARQDYRCLMVKLFDCIDNLETIHGLSPEKQERFKNEKGQIYLPLFVSMIQLVPDRDKTLYREKIKAMSLLLS